MKWLPELLMFGIGGMLILPSFVKTRVAIQRARAVQVNIKNTGNVRWTFWVGATATPSTSGLGCNITPTSSPAVDLAAKSIILDAGQTGTVILDRTCPDGAFDDSIFPGNTAIVIVKVWKDGAPCPSPLSGCLVGDQQDFTIARIAADITGISVA